MIEYRKNGTREFFKVESEKVMRVLIKQNHVLVDSYNCSMLSEEVLIHYDKATEQEFNTAFQEAKERILTENL